MTVARPSSGSPSGRTSSSRACDRGSRRSSGSGGFGAVAQPADRLLHDRRVRQSRPARARAGIRRADAGGRRPHLGDGRAGPAGRPGRRIADRPGNGDVGGARRGRRAARAGAHGDRRQRSTSPSTRPPSGTSGTTSPATWRTARCPRGKARGSPWSRRTRCSPRGAGELMIAAGNDRLFAALCDVIGAPSLVDDPRFRRNPDRVHEPRRPRRAPRGSACARRPPRSWHERLTAAGVPAAPVADVGEIARAPQTEALGLLQPLPHPAIPDLRLPALPLSLDHERALHRTRRRPWDSTRPKSSARQATTTTRSRRSPHEG